LSYKAFALNATEADFAGVCDAVRNAVNRESNASRVTIALSGGLDSMVLLAAAHRVLPISRLHAVHVHHGLSPNADAWAAHCESICQSLGVLLDVVRVIVDRNHPGGLEASARASRYDALTTNGSEIVLLAHHQDDQIETVMLQLCRGSGLRGLSAMPANLVRGRQLLLRPLLSFSKEQLKRIAYERRLAWVEDESNADSTFDRNVLRNELLPRLIKRFPRLKNGLLRVAQQSAQAELLAKELAVADGASADFLEKIRVQALPNIRLQNLLRFWLERQGVYLSEKEVAEIARQIAQAREGFSRTLSNNKRLVAKRGVIELVAK
jgi:tRNA(Ile)-lysidine synthase